MLSGDGPSLRPTGPGRRRIAPPWATSVTPKTLRPTKVRRYFGFLPPGWLRCWNASSRGMARNGTHEPFAPAILEMVGLLVATVCHHAAVHGSANVVPDRNPHEVGVPSGRRAV